MKGSTVGLITVITTGAISGCNTKEQPHQILPAPIASFSVDTAQEGELAEGDREAFGLLLPRDLKVKDTFPDAVFAIGSMPLEDVANYVRDRVEAERVDTGPAKTVFRHAKVRRAPAKRVQVEVSNIGQGKIEVVVRDETPAPAEPGLTQEERWKRAGLTPDGKKVIESKAE